MTVFRKIESNTYSDLAHASQLLLSSFVVQPNLEIDHFKIKQFCNTGVFGVEIDDKLSWNKHIDKVAKKIASGIGVIRKIPDFSF